MSERRRGMWIKDPMTDDAVSELVDFSIILSIILLATAVIVVAGIPIIKHTQETQYSQNIVQSFQVLAPNINKVVKGTSPSQSIELKMYGGTLSVTSDSYMEVNMKVWNSSNGSYGTETYGKHMGMIKNDYYGTSVAYENTGIWAIYDTGNSVMKLEPLFTYSNNVLFIPYSSLSGISSLSGSGLVRVTTDGGRRTIESYHNVSQVNISITSEYHEPWGKHLSEKIDMPIVSRDAANNTVHLGRTYTQDIDVYIIESPMHITLN